MTLKELKALLKTKATAVRAARQNLKQNAREGLPQNSWAVHADSQDFREYHIAYCLARGTPYEKIEPKVLEGNEPRWDRIEKIQSRIILPEKPISLEKDPEVDHGVLT